MSISGAFISGKISGTTIAGVQQWNAEDSAQELDGTTAEDGGFEHPDFGLAGLSVSMSLVIDVTAGDLITLSRGTVITDLGLYADITSPTPIYLVPTFLVFKSTPKGEINGRFTYDVSGKAQGSYSLSNPN